MNQQQDLQNFSLSPDSSRAALESTLATLLVSGNIMDNRLEACCGRLRKRFQLFCSTCPTPQWDRGLVITPEIRCQTEVYLPLAEMQSGFRYLLLRSCRYQPFLAAVPVFSALSWVDAVERIQQLELSFNPARIIAEAAENYEFRTAFLASLFVPKRYGNGFRRYPLQQAFLKKWLLMHSGQKLSLLDAACGSGEGVYGLAKMLHEAGFAKDSATIGGCTVEPLELAAAAHGWFPLDPRREARFQQMIAGSSDWGFPIRFFRDDIREKSADLPLNDVVICNGLLGGPLMNETNALRRAVKGLVSRVKPGGIILAADRFHAGWRRTVPLPAIVELFREEGIRIMDLPEGVGGIRTE